MAPPRPDRKAALAQTQAEAAQALKAGDLPRAVALFRRVAAAVPADPAAHYNLAGALARAGAAGEAAHGFSRAARSPRLRDGALRNLSRQLRLIPAFHPDTIDAAGLAEGLRAEGLDRQPFVRAVLDLATRSEPLAGLLALGRTQGWDEAAGALLSRDGRRARSNRAFLDALAAGVNVDADLECLLRAARRHMLQDPAARPDEEAVPFLLALARQAHNNEYVWPTAADERRAIAALANRVALAAAAAVAESGPSLALLLCYRPAWEVFGDPGDPRLDAIRPRPLQAFVCEQVASRAEERALAAEIRSLGPIADPVSQAVAAQYEANPYPRWLSTDLPAASSAKAALGPYFTADELAALDGPASLLIAGCGTGRQVVELAIQLGPEAAITAVDLSRASLGYAARMARRYGIETVAFRHADILSLDGLEQHFDVVVSDGVLHHMADPMAGWRILTDRLAPGGLMRISLYSTLARRLLDRDLARAGGSDDLDRDDADALRELRRRMFEANRADPASPPYAAYDWFTLSTFRDLVVHVQEHRYTVPEIAAALQTLGLEFRGFILPAVVTSAFRRRFADPGALRSLDAWWAFEQAEPATFANMYSFWCRKPATTGGGS